MSAGVNDCCMSDCKEPATKCIPYGPENSIGPYIPGGGEDCWFCERHYLMTFGDRTVEQVVAEIGRDKGKKMAMEAVDNVLFPN
jgi:hypothetical protein